MNRTIPVDPTASTAEKVQPAVAGEVTMQQLLDAMAHMAADIDQLRSVVNEVAGQAIAALHEADRVRAHAQEKSEQTIIDAGLIVQSLAEQVNAALDSTGGIPADASNTDTEEG